MLVGSNFSLAFFCALLAAASIVRFNYDKWRTGYIVLFLHYILGILRYIKEYYVNESYVTRKRCVIWKLLKLAATHVIFGLITIAVMTLTTRYMLVNDILDEGTARTASRGTFNGNASYAWIRKQRALATIIDEYRGDDSARADRGGGAI